jgi:acyl dehydratase
VISAYVDDIAVGDRHVTGGRTVTETHVVNFAMLTGDWHPIHTDTEYAAADDRFGARIAHGALVLSVALGLVTFWPPAMKAFYGIDKLRFVAPTRIGDTVHVETEVLDVAPRPAGDGVVTSKFVVRNQRGEDVLVAELKSLVAGKPEDSRE